MKLRLSLSAVLALAPAVALAGAASADVAPADQAKATLSVTRHDATGDQRLDSDGKQVPRRVTGSIDLSTASYHVDRTAETLTITYAVERVLATSSRYRQFFASIATTDKGRADAAASAVFVTSTDRPGVVRVYRTGSDGTASEERCAGADVVVSRAQDTVTQQIPFSCFESALDHGYLKSAAGVETRRGDDLAWDQTRYTRDLPLSPFAG